MKKCTPLIIFFIFLRGSFVHGMEPVTISDENTPLVPPRLTMKEKGATAPIFFDGTRTFYDDESRKKMRQENLKKCLCETAASSSAMGCALGGIGTTCAACLYGCTSNSTGICFYFHTGGIFLEAATLMGGVGCLITPSINILNLADTLCMDRYALDWHTYPNLEIRSEILASANPRKLVFIKTESLKKLISKTSQESIYSNTGTLPFLRKLLSCFCLSKKQIIKDVSGNHRTIRALLAKEFRTTRRIPKEVIKNIFARIDLDSLKFSYVSEKELFYLLRDLPYYKEDDQYSIIHIYADYLLLAERGWLSFMKSEKYPIECEMHYFDTDSLPNSVEQKFLPGGPTMYLPFNIQLAQHYKFEEDPVYTAEYSHPSNQQITALLAERKRIVEGRKSLSSSYEAIEL